MNSKPRDRAARAFEALWYGGSPLRWLLYPLSLLVWMLVRLRRFAYARHWLESVDAGVPVIVVGNLTAGGTGKTPLTIWLAQRLAARGQRVGIVCRGYRGSASHWPRLVGPDSDASEVGDEAKLMALRSGCAVAAGPDRVAAAKILVDGEGAQVVIADDGLQHYRLRRDFEIVVVDGARQFGNGMCLPAGPLREPMSRLRSVDAVVVNEGGDSASGVFRAGLHFTRICRLGGGEERQIEDFRGREVHAVAAIGNPQRFFDQLAGAGLIVQGHPLPDHDEIGREDLVFEDARPVLITEKDAVKCGKLDVDDVWVVAAELEFVGRDGDELVERLANTFEQRGLSL